MKLNLGSADRHIDGFVCIDIAPPECAVCDAGSQSYKGAYASIVERTVDLSRVWKWADSSIEEVMALDVCEHVGDCPHIHWTGHVCELCGKGFSDEKRRHPLGRIHFLNELHRVLIPGGRATIETPNAAKGVGMWQDLTHCSPYCLSTFKYVEHGAFAHGRLAKAYGVTAAFKVISLTESRSNGEDPREEVWKIKAILEAVK